MKVLTNSDRPFFHLPARVFFSTLHSHFNPIADSQHTSPHHGLKVKRFAKAAFDLSFVVSLFYVQNNFFSFDPESVKNVKECEKF